jgi:predicted nucleotidyltransferase
MPLKPRPDRPIDAISLTVIRAVADAAGQLGLATFMVGATARIILLEHVFGLAPGRATRDMDFAFALEDWNQFQDLKRHLTATAPCHELASVTQRLIFKAADSRHDFVVDLIPFGGLERADNRIAWPPDMSILMNVAGYRDAHAAAVPVELAPGLVIPLASISGSAVLKLFAWVDRGREDPKDAMDLVTLLRQYHEAGNQDRVYVAALPALEAAGYDIELAGAWLLGRDAATMTSAETRRQLDAIFSQPTLMGRLVTDMARALRARDDTLDHVRALLAQFLRGFAPNHVFSSQLWGLPGG